jgi:hypothetical protein
MKKALFVLSCVALLTFAFVGAAFADHSPSFYIKWDSAHAGAVAGPHAGYTESTTKCEVCHAVHRAPAPNVSWTGASLIRGGEWARAEYRADPTPGVNTQLLLMSSAAGACNYCHINTSVGGQQLYGGQASNILGPWDEGYGHHNACTGCHAVHGAFALNANNANGVLGSKNGLSGAALTGTFQGALKPAILKVGAKGTSTGWMEEVYTAGSAGYAATYAAGGAQAAPTVNDALVDPANVPLFASRQDAVMGTGLRTDVADTYEAQVSVFCTFCHQNYGTSSEATVNPNGSVSLFQAQWTAADGTNPNTAAAGINSGKGMAFKNHPMKAAGTNMLGSRGSAKTGATVAAATQVAFADASTCRDCHDAGVARGTTGIIFESFPHFTPGYWKFINAGSAQGSLDNTSNIGVDGVATSVSQAAAFQAQLDNPAVLDAAPGPSDGLCLKCHVNNAGTAGVGINF